VLKKLKEIVEQLGYGFHVGAFFVLALLRICFLPPLDVGKVVGHWAAQLSLSLAVSIIVLRILAALKAGPRIQRLVGITFLLACLVLWGSPFTILAVFLVLGFYLLRGPLPERDWSWKMELPVFLLLVINIWLEQGWLALILLAALIYNGAVGGGRLGGRRFFGP